MRGNLVRENLRAMPHGSPNTPTTDESQLSGCRLYAHDGPLCQRPYHIGHALNKILKDIIVKYPLFQRHRSVLRRADCHGPLIEQQVEKNWAENERTAQHRRSASSVP